MQNKPNQQSHKRFDNVQPKNPIQFSTKIGAASLAGITVAAGAAAIAGADPTTLEIIAQILGIVLATVSSIVSIFKN